MSIFGEKYLMFVIWIFDMSYPQSYPQDHGGGWLTRAKEHSNP